MSTTEKHQFQAEIQQLLDIVIHSYTRQRNIRSRIDFQCRGRLREVAIR